MTYRPRATCKRCGIPRGLAGGLSRRGNCEPCGVKAMADNLRDLANHSGDYWDSYRLAMVDYVARLYGGTVAPDFIPVFMLGDKRPVKRQQLTRR